MNQEEEKYGLTHFALLTTINAQRKVLKLIETNSPYAALASQSLLLFVRVCVVLRRSPGMLLDRALITHATFLQKQGDIDAVIRIARERIALCNPANKTKQVVPKLFLAENLIRAARFREAETLIDEVAEAIEPEAQNRVPVYIEFLRMKALYKETLFQWDEAYDLFLQIKGLWGAGDVQRRDLYKLKFANLCIKLRKDQEAAAVLTEMLETADGHSAILYTTAALHYSCANDLNKAAYFCAEASKLLNPKTPEIGRRVDFPSYWFSRAVLAFKQKDFESCEKFLRALIASTQLSGEAQHPALLMFLPYFKEVLQSSGKVQEAEDVALRINRIKEKYSITRNLGVE